MSMIQRYPLFTSCGGNSWQLVYYRENLFTSRLGFASLHNTSTAKPLFYLIIFSHETRFEFRKPIYLSFK